MTFSELGLDEALLQAVTDMGFESPMPIQEQAIPLLLNEETDFVGLAQTGTGKTCAYGLPILSKIDIALRKPQAIVLCPTRELCVQIAKDFGEFGAKMKKLSIAAIYGGASIENQVKTIRRGVQVVVATPGRMLDIMSRGVIDLDQIRLLVLDEADEMLDMGFREELDQIVGALPEDKHTWMFSATMSKDVEEIASNYLDEPRQVSVGGRNRAAENITHNVYVVKPKKRYDSLCRLLDCNRDIYALVFCRTRKDTQELADALGEDGYSAEAIHGDLSQAQRERVLKRFRRRQLRLLIATDVAARGLDIDDISHIIHYDLPDDLEVYTHRSGRTARAGKSGCSIVFISPAERHKLGQMERKLHIHFQANLVPDGVEVCRQRLRGIAEEFKKTPEDIDTADIDEFLPMVEDAFATVTREDMIRGLIAKELRHLKSAMNAKENLNAVAKRRGFSEAPAEPAPEGERPAADAEGEEAADRPPRDEKPMHTFEINVGFVDNIRAGAIVRCICEYGNISSKQIGHITLGRETSFFDVEESVAEEVREGMKEAELDGAPVEIRDGVAPPPREDRGPRGGHRGRPQDGRRYDRGPRDYADRGPRRYDDRPPRRYDDRGRGPRDYADRGPRRYDDRPPRRYDDRDRGPRDFGGGYRKPNGFRSGKYGDRPSYGRPSKRPRGYDSFE